MCTGYLYPKEFSRSNTLYACRILCLGFAFPVRVWFTPATEGAQGASLTVDAVKLRGQIAEKIHEDTRE